MTSSEFGVHTYRIASQTPRYRGGTSSLDNLPHPLTPLIGRQREVDSITSLLRHDHVRLLTLTGPGGIGKSRLALQVANEACHEFDDGVSFVSLASTSHANRASLAIASALGVKERPGVSIVDTLQASLRNRRLLLLVDNFEHLLPAAEHLVNLLQSSSHLKILVTSRSILHFGGEQIFPVPPLTLPTTSNEIPTPAEVLQSEAGELFVKRAGAVDPEFTLSPANAAAVADICRRLDGLPLAIELAASRSRILSPPAMLEWFANHPISVPIGDESTSNQFHSLRAAIDSSYTMLTHRERAVFRCLSTFSGGFTLEAALAAANSEDETFVSGALESFLDNSLLHKELDSDGENRFSMLEIIRTFGQNQLELAGETDRARQLHAVWCVELAERTPLGLMGSLDGRVLEQLDREHDNLRTAMEWALERGDVESCLRIANAIWSFWQHKGHLTEGSAWFDRALEAAKDSPAPLRVRALLGRAFLAYSQGDLQRSESYATESLHTYRDLGKPVGIGFSMLCLALLAENQDRDDDAIELLIQALGLFRQECHEFFTAHVLMTIGRLAYKQGDRQRAATCYEEALSVQQQLGNRMTMALTLDARAELASDAGELELALSRYLESLGLWRELDHPWGTAEVLAGIATIAARLGMLKIAASLCGAVDMLCGSVDATLTPLARREYTRTMAAVRVGIGSRAAVAIRDAGKTLSWEETLQHIASVEQHLVSASTDGREYLKDAIHLTRREAQVLELLVQGRSNQAISDALFISVPTVKVHVSHILDKFGVGSRSAVVAIALRNHGVDSGQASH